MIFKYPRLNTVSSKNENANTLMPMNMGQINRYKAFTTKTVVPSEVEHKPKPVENKMPWGEPTWYLLHTLAEKVRESVFPNVKRSFFRFIILLCNNLPCPECSQHAGNYLAGINFNAIETKEQLKTLLWNFHNTVNKKKGYPFFPLEDLNKYNRANTSNIISNFFYFYTRKNYSMKVGAHSFHKDLATKEMRRWLNQNSRYFLN
jgi:hypothetical protein